MNEFDVYVGTSAGSFISSLVANGVTPEEMMRVLNRELTSPLRDIDLAMLLRPNYKGLVSRGVTFPFRLVGMARELAGNFGEVSAVDLLTGLAGGLPNGFYTGEGIARYVEEALDDPDRSNDFRELDRELYLTATDLDTTERVVLGEGEWADVPISTAVAASGALPVVYDPVRINGREFIDGGIRSTTNVDVAVERGAKFIVVINPIVPYVNDFTKRIPTVFGDRVRRVSDMGVAAIANQSFRDPVPRPAPPRGSRLAGGVPGRRHHPDRARARRRADVRHLDPRLLEPPRDRQARLRVGHAEARPRLRPLPDDRRAPRASRSRSGGSATCSSRSSATARRLSAWRRVLEQTTSALLRQQPADAAEDRPGPG